MASRMEGAAKFRRILRQAEPEIRKEFERGTKKIVTDMLATMKSLTPRSDRRGRHVQDALTARVTSRGLTGRVGLLTKKRKRDFFYFRFLNTGTKRGMPALRIIDKTFDRHKDAAIAENAENIGRAIRRAAGIG